MRRVLRLGAVLVLATGLLSAAPPVAGQTGTITLSIVDASDTSTTITAVEEDGGAETVQVKAVASAAPAADVTVSVTVGASAADNAATRGATDDYTRSAASVTVTITNGTTEAFSPNLTITPISDTVTEEHENIRFSGTASSYTVSSVDLAITDQDRELWLRLADSPSGTRRTSWAVPESRGNLWLYGGVTLGGITNDMFTASTSSTYGSQLRTDVGYQGGMQAGLARATIDYGTDYNTWDQGSHVTIAANGLSADWQAEFGASMPIEFVDDSVVEGDEVVYLRVNPPSGFTSRRVPITIMDNDDDIGLSVSSNIIAEGQTENVKVAASFGGDSSVLSSATDVTVTLGAADTNGATPGTDFTTSGTGVMNHSFTISIPAGDVSADKTVTVAALTDANNEGVEGVAVSGSATVGGATATVTAAQISIAGPNETITLSFHEANSGEAAVSEVGERGGPQTVRVKAEAGAAVSSATTVTVTVGAPAERAATLQACTGSGPTLICSGDYARSADTFTITIANGQTDGTEDVTITPRADNAAEGAEVIRFTGSASGFAVLDADLPIAEVVSLTFSSGAVGEGAGNAGAVSVSAHFYQTSSSDLTADTDVDLTFGAGGNTEAADFTAPMSTVTVTIPAGATSSSTSVALSGLMITQDTIAEGAESIIVGGTGEGITVTGRALSITDDDLRVELTADTDSATTGDYEKDLSEGETPAVGVRAAFASGVTNGLSSDLQVRVTASEEPTASATGGGVDFTPPGSPLTLTIPTGTAVMSSWETLTGLLVTDDAAAEAAETFRITGSVSGGTVAHDTLTIGAGDDQLEVSVSPQTVWEQEDAHTITVTARFASATASEGERTVNAVVATGDSNGASLAPSCPTTNMDACTDTAMFAITIPDGSLSGSGMFNLTARDDGSPEATPETVKVTGTLAGGSSGSDSDALRIVDSAFRVELLDPADDSDLSSVGEEDGDVSVRVQVRATSSDTSRRVVGLNVTGGTATLDADGSWGAGEDFRVSGLAAPSGTPAGHSLGVVIEANEMTGTADITITPNDDKVDEDDETILVSGADVGTWPVLGAGLTITDDDDPPANIVLSLSPDEVLEDGGGAATVRVTASYEDDKESTESLTVPITVGAGTAAVGDFQAVTGVSVVIDPYENSGETTFNLTPVDDSDEEGPETVTVAGGPVAGFTIPDAALTIVDDETRIDLSLRDSSDQPLTSLEEGTASTTVTVRAAYPAEVSRPTARTVRVSVGAGEGVSASDYQATGSPFDITIPAGDNSATGTFDIVLDGDADDGISEPDERLEITGVLAGFDVTPAALTITDDDPAPTGLTLSLTPSSAPENRGNSPLTVRVRANLTDGSPRSQPTSVRVTVAGGTAANGRDYRNVVSSPFTITIPALARNATGTFTVVILNDAASGQTKQLTVTGAADSPGNPTATANFAITNVPQQDPQPNPGGGGGGGGGGAPPPSGGGGGGGGGAAPPPAQPPVAPPPPAEPACQGRFCDEDGSVHQANIERIAEWEITLGCDAEDPTKFCPSAQITRRQMAAFLYRAVSQRWTIDEPEGVEISDVPEDAWYRTFADWVVSTGAFAAPDGAFNPGGVVTRADMAVMMIASFPHISAVEEPEGLFADAAGVDPAVIRAIEGMYESGVTKGCTTTPLNYCPDNPVTRAQMASFFVRAIDLAPTPTPE